MRRSLVPCVLVILLCSTSGLADGEKGLRRVWTQSFDLTIDGETYVVAEGKAAVVRSKKNPGTKYNVVLRVAQVQPVISRSLRFEFHHSLTLDSFERRGTDDAYTIIAEPAGAYLTLWDHWFEEGDSVEADLQTSIRISKQLVQERGGSGVVVGRPAPEKLPNASKALVARLTYKDQHGVPHVRYVRSLRVGERLVNLMLESPVKGAGKVRPHFERLIRSIRAR